MARMKARASERHSALKKRQFLWLENMGLREFGAEHTYHFLNDSCGVHIYTINESQIEEIFFPVFSKGKRSITLLTGARIWQFMLQNT